MSNQLGQPGQGEGFESTEARDPEEYTPAFGDTISFGAKVLIVTGALTFGLAMELFQHYTGIDIDQYLP